MGKPDAPEAPDPKETAGAQTGQNVLTAIANQSMANVNQITPYGSLTYSQSGATQFTDPNTGEVYDIPNYTATTSLSEDQQKILDSSNQSQINLANLASNQSQRLDGLLSDPMDLSGLPDRRNYDPSQEPQMQQVGGAPSTDGLPAAQNSYGAGQDIVGSVGPSGAYQRGVMSGGIQRNVQGVTPQNTQLADAGGLSRNLDLSNVGAINGSVDLPQVGGVSVGAGAVDTDINYNRSELGGVQSDLGQTPSLNLDPNAPGYGQASQNPSVTFQQSQLGGVQSDAGLQGIRDVGNTPTVNLQQSQLGNIQTDAGLQGIRDVGNSPSVNYQRSNLGDVQSSLGDAGAINTMQGGQAVRTGFGDTGAIQQQANAPGIGQVQGADGISYNRSDLGQGQTMGAAGNIQNSIAQGQNVQHNVADAGSITSTYGGDFSDERSRVENALMERMNPSLTKDREALEARLASQGIRYGSQAYQDAMGDFNRQSNDARLGAIIAGGQEQSRLTDMEAQRAGFQNAAQMQQYQQNLSSQQAYNSAQAQEFGQNATSAAFANSAQQQGFNQEEARVNQANSLQAQLAGQTLQQDALGLQAQTANSNVQNQNAQLGLQRDIAANSAGMDAARFANEAQQQGYSQARDRFDAYNEGVGQQFGQDLAQTNQQNAAQQQGFEQLLAGGTFANAAQAQTAGQTIQQDAQQLQASGMNADLMAQNNRLGLDRDVAAGNQALQGAQFTNAAQAQGADQAIQRDAQQLQASGMNADLAAQFAQMGINRDIAAGNQTLQGAQFTNDAQAQVASQAMNQDAQRLQASGMNADLAAQNNRLNLDRDIASNRTALDSFSAGNDARNDAFSQALTRGQFANDAQAQTAGQTLQQDQLDLNAQEAQGRLGLQSQSNQLQASEAGARLSLQAQTANQQAALDAARLGNDAQQQAFNQALTSGQFQNNTQQQAFNQALQSGEFQNDAATQDLQNQLAAGSFGNAAQAQEFGQAVTNANLNNSSLSDMFNNNLASAQFANNAQAQQNDQNQQAAQFNNDSRSQQLSEMLALQNFDNAAVGQNNATAQQGFQNYMQGLSQGNQDRSSALQEQFAMRSQPINEIAALLGGSQVTQPNFVNTSGAQMPTTDVAGIINNGFGQQMQGYNAQMSAWNNIMGGLGGLGAAVISDRRLKRDIRKIKDGIMPVYEYRYLWDETGTVRRGYMAQEVLKVVPDAVIRFGKWLALDYSKLPEVA
ncbi:tail fiber domain-containing protein [Sulfitobacter mediterraneus]|uniref:tail fiber domain-containing protein n=1 Tax=Sulfitobacter mediterraneus TaxID=83219 RepID=UPI00193A6AAC|nr:tail fiber domain-containing protein [Sulfitobacter mediterraneus]MBM1556665.1 tail fiber domain-containing protein [Sulfitobacter mediterraneus]MBM1570138.1 tail fiber domain-containing protein [Sulfitobacter mediterraneus]MBM1574095.1 tail fiber domain-containing protein [Sulfitobacter mediterraneus]MBM1577880.1 tail fiber domain-containing protein [Sulfitobacter mediterraneus]MBM1579623.1 tail fiber domain-containing protein [Sulfitobacter mediterraneus]